MAAPLLRADGLVRRYRLRQGMFRHPVTVKAVDGLSLSLASGETLGIVGESGCGKSTTGRLLVGLEPPDAGTISFAGEPLPAEGHARWRRLRTRIQMVFQDPLGALDRRLTIGTQIAEPSKFIGSAVRAKERTGSIHCSPMWA